MSCRSGMDQSAIRVAGLGKLYELGSANRHASTLRDALPELARRLRPGRGSSSHRAASSDTSRQVWALRDVSFEVEPGVAVGLIGPNGAGKSTLLRILSRVSKPSTGWARISGRVGSLLEVGTGFHPELTGRENVFLSGAILGMRKAEITRRFDEIVAFAEVERFIETPVKHYSSGMHVRLGFAVAAFLSAEVLIIDEVLAVGDYAFQARCLSRIRQLLGEGTTLLFVTHDLATVQALCPRVLLLRDGRLVADGHSRAVVAQYLSLVQDAMPEQVWEKSAEAPGNDSVQVHAVRVLSGGRISAEVPISVPVVLEVEFWNREEDQLLSSSIHLFDQAGTAVLASSNTRWANLASDDWYGRPHPPGLFRTRCELPAFFLNEGRYSIDVLISRNLVDTQVHVRRPISFVVRDTGEMRGEYSGPWFGVVRPRLAWSTELLTAGLPTTEGEAYAPVGSRTDR